MASRTRSDCRVSFTAARRRRPGLQLRHICRWASIQHSHASTTIDNTNRAHSQSFVTFSYSRRIQAEEDLQPCDCCAFYAKLRDDCTSSSRPAESWHQDTEEIIGAVPTRRKVWAVPCLQPGTALSVLRCLRWPMRVLAAWAGLLLLACPSCSCHGDCQGCISVLRHSSWRPVRVCCLGCPAPL